MRKLKHLIPILIFVTGLACGYAASEIADNYYSSTYTLLIKNVGISSLNIYDSMGKLAWVLPGQSECVKLRSISQSQQLKVHVGRSVVEHLSPFMRPVESGYGGWVWEINDRLMTYSMNTLDWAEPCKL